MSDEPKVPTIKMYFNWKSFAPDLRRYKPSNPVIEVGGYFIVVEVPLTSDLIYNGVAIMGQQLSGQGEEQPILTPLGMRYIIDQFETVMSNKVKDTTETENDTDEWADTEEDKVDHTLKNDTWDESETDEPTVEKTDEKWDENWS